MLRVSAILAALALAACENHEAAALTRIKQRVCACPDVKCAETALKDVPQGDVKSNHRAQVVARDMLDCLAKLYAAQRPSTDPDGGSAAP